MKICILSYRFFTGGFTGSLLPLLKHLNARGIEVDLMLFEKGDEDKMDTSFVNIVYNSTPRRSMSKLEKAIRLFFTPHFVEQRKYRKKHEDDGDIVYRNNVFVGQTLNRLYVMEYTEKCDLSQYDCVIAWEEGYTSYFLANAVTAKKKIGYIHPDYQRARFCKFADEIALQGLDKIAFVSQATTKSFQEAIPSLADKAICIPNTLVVKEIVEKSKEETTTFEKGRFDIISVCRLDNVSKALDRAVRVSARLKADGLDFKWYFVGDGVSRELMEGWIKEYGVEDTVILLGEKKNPHPYTINADLFVLQSYYEGKPMSVAEAMILETPVMISHFASAYEQVDDGVTGFIAENDEDSIYEKLKEIITHPEKLQQVRENLAKVDKHATFEDITPFLDAVKN